MRRAVLTAALAVLGVLVGARASLATPEQAAAARMDSWGPEGYNVLDLALPVSTQTAGSALVAEMDCYYLGRAPTAKNVYTGRLAGQNLILILAENWTVPSLEPKQAPGAYRLWSEGARFREYYAPDWYQGMDGREFALLTGMVPTAVGDETAMAWMGRGDVYLPFALARCLAAEGYACQVRAGREGMDASYKALGFESVRSAGDPAADLPALKASQPFLAYYVLEGPDPEPALEDLLAALEEQGMDANTAVCVAAGHEDPLRGHLFLWAGGMAGAPADGPCSELDVTATLLNLLGAGYDSRFLSGRDAFAPWSEPSDGTPPLVSLYGSAYSDWVTDAGSYLAGEERFFPAEGAFAGDLEARRYVARICREVYDRYIYARRVMENNYFQLAMGR